MERALRGGEGAVADFRLTVARPGAGSVSARRRDGFWWTHWPEAVRGERTLRKPHGFRYDWVLGGRLTASAPFWVGGVGGRVWLWLAGVVQWAVLCGRSFPPGANASGSRRFLA
jgi:hypothetical protein